MLDTEKIVKLIEDEREKDKNLIVNDANPDEIPFLRFRRESYKDLIEKINEQNKKA